MESKSITRPCTSTIDSQLCYTKKLNNINDNNSVVELSVYFKTDKSFPCIGFFNNKSNFASGFFFVMVRMDQFQPVCPSPPRGVQ